MYALGNAAPLLLGALVLIAAAMLAHGRWSNSTAARAWRKSHAPGADGVVPGAHSLALDGDARAVLLLHGFGDTPQSVAKLAAVLRRRGFTVRAPLLPGHGRSLEVFRRSRASEWLAATARARDEIADSHAQLFIVGVSMGGALAAWLAQDTALARTAGESPPTETSVSRKAPDAVVLLAPYLDLPSSGRFWARIWPIWSLWRPWVAGDAAASIRDPHAREESLGYGSSTPRVLCELCRVVEVGGAATPLLRAPTLAIFSTGDYRIPEKAARLAFDRIGATVKEVLWVERSGHVITVDHDADLVIERTVAWLERFSRVSPSGF